MSKERFTDTLRRIDDADLSPHHVRLLLHYWRRGHCWEPLRTTAESCGMSLGMVSKTKKELLEDGWIKLEVSPKNNKMSVVLCSQDEQIQQLDSSQDEQCSCDEHYCSCDEQNTVESVHVVNAPINKELNEPNILNEPREIQPPPPENMTDNYLWQTAYDLVGRWAKERGTFRQLNPKRDTDAAGYYKPMLALVNDCAGNGDEAWAQLTTQYQRMISDGLTVVRVAPVVEQIYAQRQREKLPPSFSNGRSAHSKATAPPQIYHVEGDTY